MQTISSNFRELAKPFIRYFCIFIPPCSGPHVAKSIGSYRQWRLFTCARKRFIILFPRYGAQRKGANFDAVLTDRETEKQRKLAA